MNEIINYFPLQTGGIVLEDLPLRVTMTFAELFFRSEISL